MGTASKAKMPVLMTNAAGGNAAPEKYPPRNQRVTSAPGTRNRIRVATSKAPGSVAKASRKGPIKAKDARPESPMQASNQRPGALPFTSPVLRRQPSAGQGARESAGSQATQSRS